MFLRKSAAGKALSLLGLGVLLTACSVWETKHRSDVADKDAPTEQSEAIGQPYFLPKGLIHLVITPVVAPDASTSGAASSQGQAAATTVQLPTGGSATVNLGTSPPDTGGPAKGGSGQTYNASFQLQYPKAPQAPAPTPAPAKVENHVTYKVTAEVKMVPDRKAGVFYARYRPNVLFSDNVSISTTPDGLLSAVSSSTEDRSPQILSNLEDTALDVGEFLAAGGIPPLNLNPAVPLSKDALNLRLDQLESSQSMRELSTTKPALQTPVRDAIDAARRKTFHFEQIRKQVNAFITTYQALKGRMDDANGLRFESVGFYQKRLNIDEYFDPFDPEDCDRIQSLFCDRKSGVPVPEYSPVKLQIVPHRRAVATDGLPGGCSRRDGLCFREPTQVEVILQQNDAYLKDLRTKLALQSSQEMSKKVAGLISNKDDAAYLSGLASELLDQIKSNTAEFEALWNDSSDHPPKAPASAATPTPAATATPTATPTPTKAPAGETKKADATVNGSPASTPNPAASPTPAPIQPSVNEQELATAVERIRAFFKKAETEGGGQTLLSSETELERYLAYLSDAKQEIARVKPALERYSGEVDQQIAAVTARANTLRDQAYYGNLRGEMGGLGRFNFTVPDKERPFMLNVPRSAFVLRSMTVAIQSGMLLGFTHVKPSEAEGFTTIPLTLAQKLASVPRALFQAKNDSLQGQDTLIKSQTQLVSDQRALNSARNPTPPAPAASPARGPVTITIPQN